MNRYACCQLSLTWHQKDMLCMSVSLHCLIKNLVCSCFTV